MQTKFIVEVSQSLEDKQLGQLSEYLTVDNPTGQWWYEKNANQYFPPWTMDMTIHLNPAAQVAAIIPQTPLGAFSNPVPGQVATFIYSDADVTIRASQTGGSSLATNPAGAPEPNQPTLAANQGSDYRSTVGIAQLPTEGTGLDGYAQTEGTRRVPAPLNRVAVAVAGTPALLGPLLAQIHSQIDGMTIVPSDANGRVLYGDSFERASPEKLWSLAGGAMATSDVWAVSGSKSVSVTQSGTDDGVATRRFPLPKIGGQIGVEVTSNGAVGTPNAYYLMVTVNGPQANAIFGVRMEANVPSIWDNALGQWQEIEFPPAVAGLFNNVGDSTGMTPMKIVIRHLGESLAYSHIVINGCFFNLMDRFKVVQNGVTPPDFLDVSLGVEGDTASALFDDVKITDNEPADIPTTTTLGVAD